MLHLTLQRNKDTGKETLGQLKVEGHDEIGVLYTIERPWLDNKPKISCIPPGTYKFVPHNWEESPAFKFKKVYRLLDVPGRSAILIHAGNRVQDVIGCIAPGKIRGTLYNDPAVIQSREAMDVLRKIIGNNSGSITIFPVDHI